MLPVISWIIIGIIRKGLRIRRMRRHEEMRILSKNVSDKTEENNNNYNAYNVKPDKTAKPNSNAPSNNKSSNPNPENNNKKHTTNKNSTAQNSKTSIIQSVIQ